MIMSQEVYAIMDLDGYISQIRDAAAKSISDDYDENLDEFISVKQMLNMIKKECLGYDDDDRPLLDEDANERIFENTAIWINNVGLAKLAAKDLVECAWDEDSNEMVFWVKKKEEDDKRKPRRKNKKSEG